MMEYYGGVRHTTDYYVSLFTNGMINDYLMHAHSKKLISNYIKLFFLNPDWELYLN